MNGAERESPSGLLKFSIIESNRFSTDRLLTSKKALDVEMRTDGSDIRATRASSAKA